MDFLLEHSNITGDIDLGDDDGETLRQDQYEDILRTMATKIGLNEGESVLAIPEDSNMSGAGKNGADIGANVLYRYNDQNELTDELLWDPETGAFPHGTVIEGINDVPGDSLFDLGERVNSQAAIPEPASGMLISFGGLMLGSRRRSRRGR